VKKNLNILKPTPKDEFEMWELGVPSHEVTHKEAFLTKNSLKHCLLTEQPLYLLLCKGTLTCAQSDKPESNVVSPKFENLLKEFDDIFPSDDPTRLPPFRGIENQIDFVPSASLPKDRYTKQIWMRPRR